MPKLPSMRRRPSVTSSPRACRGRLSPCPGGRRTSSCTATISRRRTTAPATPLSRLSASPAYQVRILELTTFVITHPYWATLEGPDRVEARTALKHAHDPAAPEA